MPRLEQSDIHFIVIDDTHNGRKLIKYSITSSIKNVIIQISELGFVMAVAYEKMQLNFTRISEREIFFL